MDEYEDDEGNLRIELEHELKCIRLMENTFMPSTIKIRAEVIPTSDSIENDEFEVALIKCKFWLDNVVSKCIVFCRENKAALQMLLDANGKNLCSNMLMLTPYIPSDDHLAGLFQAKLTALSNGDILFGSVKIKSDNMFGLVFEFVGDSDEYLPSMEEWIGDHSYFDEPWWNRNDASTLDVIPQPDADLSVKPAWAYNFDFLEQTLNNTSDDIIVRPEFIPKVIKGGKDDE